MCNKKKNYMTVLKHNCETIFSVWYGNNNKVWMEMNENKVNVAFLKSFFVFFVD